MEIMEDVYYENPELIINPEEVGRRLKQLRKNLKITVSRVSAYMGFTNDQAIYKWERGASIPTCDHLIPLARLYRTTVDYILTGNNFSTEADDESASY